MKRFPSIIGLLATIVVISGCGTVQTVAVDRHEAISITANGENTRCDRIPRIYSGIAWNFCYLNTPYGATAGRGESTGVDPIFGVPTVFFDFALSAAFDTVALPWTIYTQSTRGSIEVQN